MKTIILAACFLSLCLGSIGASYKSSTSTSRSTSASKPSTSKSYKSSAAPSRPASVGAKSSSTPSGNQQSYKSSTAPSAPASVSQTSKPQARPQAQYNGNRPNTGTVNTRTYVYRDYHHYGGGWGYTFWWHPYDPFYFSFWHPYSWFYIGQPVAVLPSTNGVPLEAPAGSYVYRPNYWGIATVSILSLSFMAWLAWLIFIRNNSTNT